MHGDKARAEAGDAGIILVAVGLVDLALAPEFGFLRQHRHAKTFLATIAAAFAHQRIDHHPLGRIDQFAALATATLFGRAGLVEDQDRHAFDGTQMLLHCVQFATIVKRDLRRKQVASPRPLADVVADHRNLMNAFGAQLMCNVGHGERAVHRLPAGHRHRIVVENLVGDVDASGDRLPDRQRAAMEIRAIAQVLEHMRGAGKRCLPRPRHPFAAHVGEGVGGAVHPGHHVVATDAAQRARAFRHGGGGVVRAARAVMRHARELRARQGHFRFLGIHPAQALLDRIGIDRARLQQAQDAPADHRRDGGRCQFAGGWQDPRALLIVLADDARPRTGTGRPVVEQLLHLALDEGFFLFHHHDVFQALRKRADAHRFQRPGHADLVDADADLRAGLRVQAQIFQRLQHIQVALAGGDDAQACVR